MNPYWQSSDVTLYCGDARTVWRDLPPASVHAIVTSPPYYGLRDYGVDGQLGLESTPAEYVETLADLLTSWGTSVLRADGSLWLNLGDSYSGSWGNYRANGDPDPARARLNERYGTTAKPPSYRTEFPNKCLLMIPERVALALIDRGWILRNKIAWTKGNGMPSSATDRLATKWEYVFLFTRLQRYYFDLDAIREPHGNLRQRSNHQRTGEDRAVISGGPGRELKAHGRTSEGHEAGANPGDHWAVNTVPNPFGHFAMFPPELVRRPILATVPEWACRACGKGRERITERDPRPHAELASDAPKPATEMRDLSPTTHLRESRVRRERWDAEHPHRTVGWSDCGCDAGFTSGVVADPFAGAGTTAVMARRLGRRSLLCELNATYCQLIARRLQQDVLTWEYPHAG